MTLLKNMTIKFRMILSFVLIVALFVVFGMISMGQMGVLGGLTATLYNHPLKVSNASLNAKTGIISMHRNMKDLSIADSKIAVNAAIRRVEAEEAAVYGELETVRGLILGEEGKKLVDETVEMFARWKPIRQEVEELVLRGERSAANRITREKGADYVARLERKLHSLTSYALNKADGFMGEAEAVEKRILRNTVIFVVALTSLSLLIGFLVSSSILASVTTLKRTMARITDTGELSEVELEGKSEITEMGTHFNGLIDRLRRQFWFAEGQNHLSRELAGELTYDEILSRSIAYVARYTDACAGALYTCDGEDRTCRLKSSYAFVERKYLANRFEPGEGIVGQVAVEKKAILLTNITSEEAVGRSGTASEPPRAIYAVPLFHMEKLYGVLEIASFEEIGGIKREFIDAAANIVSVALHTAFQSDRIKNLLEVSRDANERLQAQTEELQAQTQELQSINAEFQQQSHELKEQNTELDAQRRQVEEANRLKSEFLSNMSHELRTPLNSVNALSRVLILQAGEKLTEEEVGFLEIIERNGKHLLSLINDILDLSKIEAGRMDISLSRFSVKTVLENIMESIQPIADAKEIALERDFVGELPRIESDESRVFQILQNIIANGVKFTDRGSVRVTATALGGNVVVRVKDTGIGISSADIGNIFEEFRQVDSASTRKFEGTGLGLAIAYKAALMLGGDITVESAKGIGTTFTVTLPVEYGGPKKILDAASANITLPELLTDAAPGKRILIVDDDPGVLELISGAFEKEGYETLTTTSGKEALRLAEKYQPFAVTLDVIMPEMDGWEVLSRLKRNPATAGIPVIIVSVSDERDTGYALGAVGYVTKPVDRDTLIGEINKIYGFLPARVMVVDDNDLERRQTAEIISAEGIRPLLADGGKTCLELLDTVVPDVVVLDLMMPGMDGFELLDRIRSAPETAELPVIVVTAKDLALEEKKALENRVSSILRKAETTGGELVGKIKEILGGIGRKGMSVGSPGEKGTILLVEDNEAATIQVTKALESIGLTVVSVRDGRQAIAFMAHTTPHGIILDLMMPEVDGFQVLESIRETERAKDIPVLILTAKDVTPEDLRRLSSNNVRQLVQKGDVDREGLLDKVRRMIGDIPPETDRAERGPGPGARVPEGDAASTRLPGSASEEVGTAAGALGAVSREERTGGILVVEDNPDNMTTIKAVLGKGYRIWEAMDGEEGLKKAVELIPDLILLDISLPKRDGLSVVEELKRDERTRHIPVVALTAQAMKGDREKMILAGCDDYAAKPVEPELIKSKVEKWLAQGV